MDIKVGDRVTLQTSAMPMTVEQIKGDDVTCVRMNARGKPERDTFKSAVLKPFVVPRPIQFRF